MGNQLKSHISDEIAWQTFSRTLPKRLETSTSFSGKSMTLREQQEEAFGIQVIKKERANETALSNMLLFNGEHHARKVSPNVTLDILSNNPKITWTQGSKSSLHEFSTSSLRGGDIGRVSGSGDPTIRTKSLLVKDSGKTEQFVPGKSKVESYLNNSPSFLNDNPFFTLDSLPLKDEAGSRDIKKLNLKLFSSEHLWRSCGKSLNISNFLDQSKKRKAEWTNLSIFQNKKHAPVIKASDSTTSNILQKATMASIGVAAASAIGTGLYYGLKKRSYGGDSPSSGIFTKTSSFLKTAALDNFNLGNRPIAGNVLLKSSIIGKRSSSLIGMGFSQGNLISGKQFNATQTWMNSQPSAQAQNIFYSRNHLVQNQYGRPQGQMMGGQQGQTLAGQQGQTLDTIINNETTSSEGSLAKDQIGYDEEISQEKLLKAGPELSLLANSFNNTLFKFSKSELDAEKVEKNEMLSGASNNLTKEFDASDLVYESFFDFSNFERNYESISLINELPIQPTDQDWGMPYLSNYFDDIEVEFRLEETNKLWLFFSGHQATHGFQQSLVVDLESKSKIVQNWF